MWTSVYAITVHTEKLAEWRDKMNQIDIFNETVEASSTFYGEHTRELVRNTKVYEYPINDLLFMPHPKMPNKDMKINIVNGSTADIAEKCAVDNIRVAVLNFANPIIPGGAVKEGGIAQEESLCKCSNLYWSLVSDEAKTKFYEPNKDSYGARVIYSPNVVFFRDDLHDYEPLKHPFVADVITCDAPYHDKNEYTQFELDLIHDKALQIVKSAILNKVDILVLGAWGCGVFHQDPFVIANTFKDILSEYSAFDRVVFAILNSTTNEGVFKQVFRDFKVGDLK